MYTLGCKLNFAETSSFGRNFTERGYKVVDFNEQSDVVVVNTCSVTENADRDCRKIVRKALRRSPDAYVIVVGCYAQLRPEEIASIDGVDLVLGADEKFRMFEFAGDFSKERIPKIHVGDIEEATNYSPAFSDDSTGRTRAFLKVQDGCDYNCSFCTIPLARGASRSAPVDATIENARTLIAEGYKEIVLSGVNVGDYGTKIGTSLHELLLGLLALEGDFRLRISSIEPNLLTDEIIDLARGDSRLCRHFHIPLQSGSPEVLRNMRRRYTRDLYRERIERIAETMPDCAIGIDVIVGFPGETDRHFEETYQFLNELPFTYLHVFSYSERPDTHALSFGETVDPQVRSTRSKMLRTLSEKKRRAFYERHIGDIRPMLLEGNYDGDKQIGFTDNYIKVGIPKRDFDENTLLRVQLSEIGTGFVLGDPVSDPVLA